MRRAGGSSAERTMAHLTRAARMACVLRHGPLYTSACTNAVRCCAGIPFPDYSSNRRPSMTHHIDRSRRHALASLSALSLAPLSPWALAQAPLTVGVIYVGPRDDFGYNQAQAAGRGRAQEDARRQGGRGRERARDRRGAEDDDRHDRAGRRRSCCSPPRSATSIRTSWRWRRRTPTCASRIAAACGPKASTRRTPAASSATSTSAST